MKTKYVNIMKTKFVVAFFAILIGISACDDFGDMNIDPLSPAALDPVYSLVSAEIMAGDMWHFEAEMVQQVQLIIGGQEAGGNRNIQNNNYTQIRWNDGYGRIRSLVDIIQTLEGNTDRTNLYNMARILKAFNAMMLVDTYGDVPYFSAGLGYLEGTYYPVYDNQEDIYEDIAAELEEATDALDATKDLVKGEFYFKGDIAKWKKFGNSLLLRVGMRYSKQNPTLAQTIVQTAVDPARGGVITTNSDNVIVPFNATQTNTSNMFLTGSVRQNWHAGKPFVDFLNNNVDPRMIYWICLYSAPGILTGGTRDTTRANQIGVPYGYDETNIETAPNYPGTISAGVYKYSQLIRQTSGRVDAWFYVITAAQTQLLMAEATQRNWISTGTTAQQYYENAITQALTQADTYSETRGGASPISGAQITAYLARPNIAYNGADNEIAFEQINSQYWVASYLNWHEAWCNHRRSGYPDLDPINYSGQDQSVTEADGFIHRFVYPAREYTANTEQVEAAAAQITNGDELGSRVFWDIP